MRPRALALLACASPIVCTGRARRWDVSKVTNLDAAFAVCFKFNGDISKWDVSRVQNLHGAFLSHAWKGDISNWNVGKVKI